MISKDARNQSSTTVNPFTALPLNELLPQLSPEEATFFAMLDAQLEKVGVFYVARQEEVKTRWKTLREQLDELGDHMKVIQVWRVCFDHYFHWLELLLGATYPKPGMVFHIFPLFQGWTSIPAHEEWYTIKGIKPRSSRFHGRLIIFHLVNLVVMFNRPQSTHHSIRRAARWLENAQRYIHTIQTIICMRRRSSKKPF